MGQNSNCVSVYVGFFFDGVFSVLRLFLAATIFFCYCLWDLSSQFLLGTPEATKWIRANSWFVLCSFAGWLTSECTYTIVRMFVRFCLFGHLFCLAAICFVAKIFCRMWMWEGDILISAKHKKLFLKIAAQVFTMPSSLPSSYQLSIVYLLLALLEAIMCVCLCHFHMRQLTLNS